jgi:hypothetical protein
LEDLGVVCSRDAQHREGGDVGVAAATAASNALNEYRQGRLSSSRRCIDAAVDLCRGSTHITPPPETCPSNISSAIAKWASLLPLATGRGANGLDVGSRDVGEIVGGRRVVHNLEGTRIRDIDPLDASSFGVSIYMYICHNLVPLAYISYIQVYTYTCVYRYIYTYMYNIYIHTCITCI